MLVIKMPLAIQLAATMPPGASNPNPDDIVPLWRTMRIARAYVNGFLVYSHPISYRWGERRCMQGRPMAVTFGEKLKELREKQGYSLEQLAILTESSKSHLWEIEKGRAPVPGGEKLAKIARVLETTVHALLVEQTDPESADEQDRIFFRNYRSLDDTTRENMRKMVAALQDKKKG